MTKQLLPPERLVALVIWVVESGSGTIRMRQLTLVFFVPAGATVCGSFSCQSYGTLSLVPPFATIGQLHCHEDCASWLFITTDVAKDYRVRSGWIWALSAIPAF